MDCAVGTSCVAVSVSSLALAVWALTSDQHTKHEMSPIRYCKSSETAYVHTLLNPPGPLPHPWLSTMRPFAFVTTVLQY